MIVFMTKIPSHLSSAQMTDGKKLTVKFENKKPVGLRVCAPIPVSLVSFPSHGVDSILWKKCYEVQWCVSMFCPVSVFAGVRYFSGTWDIQIFDSSVFIWSI